MWHKIFATFTIFRVIGNNKFLQKIITANFNPAKIYSKLNILWLKFATQKYGTKKYCVCLMTSLFHSETKQYAMDIQRVSAL